jgi:hypothetical protein
MARSIHRRWTADDVTKLRQLAGKHPRNAIAAQLGRRPSALAVKAHQLKVSLRVVRNNKVPTFSGADPGPAGFSIGPSDQGSSRPELEEFLTETREITPYRWVHPDEEM